MYVLEAMQHHVQVVTYTESLDVFGNEVKLIKATSYGSYAWESDWSGQGSTWNSSTKPDIRTYVKYYVFLNTLE